MSRPGTPYEWAMLAVSALVCVGFWWLLRIPPRRGEGMKDRLVRAVERILDRLLGPCGHGRTCGRCRYWRYANRDCDPRRPDRRPPFGHLGVCGYYELPCATEVPWGWRRYEPGKSMMRARQRACEHFRQRDPRMPGGCARDGGT